MFIVGKIKKKLVVSYAHQDFDQKYCKLTIYNTCFLSEYTLNVIYSCDTKLYYQHHYSSLQCQSLSSQSFRNNYLKIFSVTINGCTLVVRAVNAV